MRVTKWISIFVVLTLILALLPCQVMAKETEEFQIIGRQEENITVFSSATTQGPALADGNHEKWIDRIANLPDYAADFYTWLEDNATATGALVNPALGTNMNGDYVYTLTTITGTTSYTYTNDKKTAAQEAAIAHMGNKPNIAMQYAAAVYGAFDHDHPEVFWLSGSSVCAYALSYSYSGFGGSGTVEYPCGDRLGFYRPYA